ncbi:DUF6559 family protein [Pseudoalteromonas luteoviolacea]|uniref:Uncharacterized protein n=1 Tax=Pseudoalteromonas luteoviolacea DSM 6061 TaxID=1365250 RepID=A0A166WUV3_9GAMM|nr:DUF6559 family protein [Pseudoalteromonas luteoviolacea]KZN38103.1 hypothetical protein N475_15860 [Pseudoalteromonas luteoviolacea DSM 6061]MBE0388875.1 hypothetical protein [Pseudoalteromonas luteoviolacea DSM 6061]
MLDALNKNSITSIAIMLPKRLLEAHGKKAFFPVEEVLSTFMLQFKSRHNIEYAYAMFCSESDFDTLQLTSIYGELRAEIAKVCFESWPRFNFDTLLDYSSRFNPRQDGGIFGPSDSCSDGGCGGGE